MRLASSLDPATRWNEISILLTDNEGIAALNKRYLDKDGPTDVLCFRYEPGPSDKAACDGELIVNVERALEVGPAHSGVPEELALYIAHGCDHLAGQDDQTGADFTQMRERELAWLKEEAASITEIIE